MGGSVQIEARLGADVWPALVDPTQLELATMRVTPWKLVVLSQSGPGMFTLEPPCVPRSLLLGTTSSSGTGSGATGTGGR
jgi:hypothetical protein